MINNFYLILIPIIIIFINCFKYKNLKVENFTDNTSEGTNKDLIKKFINKSYNSSVFENIEYIVEKLEKIKNNEFVDNLGIAGNFNLIPFQKGMIVAFSGEEVPVGWAECNGENVINSYGDSYQTPDLREKFVLGTKEDAGSSGGEKEVKLDKNNLPKHRHNMKLSDNHSHKYNDKYLHTKSKGSYSRVGINKGDSQNNHRFVNNFKGEKKNKFIYSGRVDRMNPWDKYTSISDQEKKNNLNHTHSSGDEGNNVSHNNMPPYYVLKYIIKIE